MCRGGWRVAGSMDGLGDDRMPAALKGEETHDCAGEFWGVVRTDSMLRSCVRES